MVKSIISIVAFWLLTCSLKAQTGDVLFKINGINTEQGGSISLGIFLKENFPQIGKQFRGKDVPVTNNRMEIRLEDVPVGTYGAVAFQDQNDDKELETNFVGLPKEPIGFANGAKIRFGPPKFEDASITVSPGETVIVNIQLK